MYIVKPYCSSIKSFNIFFHAHDVTHKHIKSAIYVVKPNAFIYLSIPLNDR